MSRWFIRLGLIAIFVAAFPRVSPAPLIHTDEGWRYVPVGAEDEKWRQANAKVVMEVAQTAFDAGDMNLAVRAARRVVQAFPFSNYAPDAQYLLAQCYENTGDDEKAFNAYQELLTKYPKLDKYNEALEGQYRIAERFLGGQRFRIWGLIPYGPSMDKTAVMFSSIVTNGPHSATGPKAQMGIGAARERQHDYPKAVDAYQVAADRYSADEKISAEALYRVGLAYQKQSRRAEYDQSAAAQAIASFTDFAALHSNDPRVPETQQAIADLRTEQARGSFETARYYEEHGKLEAARIYYNEVDANAPKSAYAELARRKIEELNRRLGSSNRGAVVATVAPGPTVTRPPAEPIRSTAPPTPAPAESVPTVTPPPKTAETPPAKLPPEAGGWTVGPTGGQIAGANSIQILPFENKTLEPGLSEPVTTALRRVIQQDGLYRLRTDGAADLVVSGTITDYKRTELTLSKNDLSSVRDYQVLLGADVRVVERATGKVILARVFKGFAIMPLGNDLPSLERQTHPQLAEDLARNIVTAITEGKW